MTPIELVAILTTCGLAMPPTLTAGRILAHAQEESGHDFGAVSPPNRNGSRDYGFMQINEIHFERFRVTRQSVMEPCTNLRIGMAILTEADARAACIYNTGRPNCTNGYDVRIMRAAAALMNAQGAPEPAASSPTPQPALRPGCVVPEWDVWARCPSPAPTLPATIETQSPDEPVVLRGLAMGTPSR